MTRKTDYELSEHEKALMLSLKEAIAYEKGELTAKDGVVVHSFPKVPDHVDVKAIREKLHLTQEEFSQFGFSLSAVRHWEQGRRQPNASTRVLLKVIEHCPQDVFKALSTSSDERPSTRH